MADTTKDDELRDLLIEAKFNIKPGDSTEHGLVVTHPHIKHAIDQYFDTEEASRLAGLIFLYGNKQEREGRLDELENTVFKPLAGRTWLDVRPDVELARISMRRDELASLKGKETKQ